MTVRTYRCNFCREEFKEVVGEPVQNRSGFGVKWTTEFELKQTLVHDSENHICIVCVNAIKNLEVKT